jgi:DNA repair exonuclease SbcCD ATPase subunit
MPSRPLPFAAPAPVPANTIPAADLRARIAELQAQAEATESAEAKAKVDALRAQLETAAEAVRRAQADEAAADIARRIEATKAVEKQGAALVARIEKNAKAIETAASKFAALEAEARSLWAQMSEAASDAKQAQQDLDALSRQAQRDGLAPTLPGRVPCITDTWQLTNAAARHVKLASQAVGRGSVLGDVGSVAARMTAQRP